MEPMGASRVAGGVARPRLAKGMWYKAVLHSGAIAGVSGTVLGVWGITQASLSSPGFAVVILAGIGVTSLVMVIPMGYRM